MRKKNMNKAVKSLSFALALSMGLSFVPGFNVSEVKAAAKSGVVLHGKKTIFSAKKGTSAYIGEKKVDLDLIIKGKNISKKVKWSSADKNIVSVNKTTGKLTAKSNGSAVITAKYKNKKYKALVKVFTRAESMTLEDNGTAVTEVNLTEGDSKTLTANYKLSDKVSKAGGVSSTYNTYVTADNSDVVSLSKLKASAKDFTITANKVGESYIDVIGSQRSAGKATADSKKVTARIKVVVASKPSEFMGKQTGAKKITVTGQKLTNNVKDYTVKLGLSTRDITSVTLNSSATEAVLEMTANIQNGDYTVEFGGKSVAFKGEEAKVTNIDVPNKYLVLNGDNSSSGGTIEYVVKNQFNEDITKTVFGLTVNASVGTATVNPSKGTIDVTGMAANLSLNMPINLNISKIDTVTQIVKNFNLTLAAKSKANSVTVKGLYSNNTRKPYNLTVNNASENGAARLLVEVKDQYGRKMKSTDGVSITFSPGLTGLMMDNVVYSTLMTVDGTDYIAIPLKGTDGVKAGTATVTFVSLYGTSGNNITTTKVEVSGTKQVSKLSITAPSEVYAGETAYFNYSATNDAGVAITDYSILSNDKYGVKLPEAFSWENTANGTAKLKYDAKKDNHINGITWSSAFTQMQTTAIFTIASNMQPVPLTFTVNAPAIPTSLRNFTVEGVLVGKTTENVLTKVKVIDNKGRELTDLSGMSNYYLGVKKNGTGTRFSINAPGATVAAGVTLVKLSELNSKTLSFAATDTSLTSYETERFTFAIYKDATGTNQVAGSEINVNVTAADIKNLTSFNLSLPSAIYSSSDSTLGYDAVSPVVTGVAGDGSVVKLDDTNFTIRDAKGLVVGNVLKPSRGYEDAKKGDFTDTVTAVVNNPSGTEVTKTVTVSVQTPTVTKVEAKTSELALANFTFEGIRDELIIYDKYTSVANGVNPSTEFTKKTLYGIKLVSSSNSDIKAEWNNTSQVVFSGAKAGDMVTVEATFASGVKGTFNFKLK
ncbi:MAG: Ig-like domain-containing protein [Catonella sp.]|uniref:Ig-like domain-containing protein n=1 Tax=Catonella sp. TaxID=2382125 RepID=UPI003FA19336